MKNIYIIIFIQIVSFCYSQVGINTINPQGIFHIDGAKDNGSSVDQTVVKNDFYVGTDGKIGIGTINPSVKLHIDTQAVNMGFNLSDGTQGEGKLLQVLNSNGDVAWEKRTLIKVISADGGGFNGSINSDLNYISRKVTLEPGKWVIMTNLLLYAGSGAGNLDSGFNARFSWAEYNGTSYIPSNDAIFGNVFGAAFVMRYAIARGSTIIENNTTSNKTYYLVNRTPIFFGNYNQANNWNSLGAGWWGETSIIAFPAN